MWSRGGSTKIQTTTRPDHVWPEVWTKIGNAAENREKQEWVKEMPKLDNARRVQRNSQKCKEKTGKTHGTSNALQEDGFILAPRRWLQRRKLHTKRFLPKMYGCKVDSHESTRQLMESSLLTKHKDHIAGKGFTLMTHYNIGAQIYSCASSNEDSGCKSCSGRNGKKFETENTGMAADKSQKTRKRWLPK